MNPTKEPRMTDQDHGARAGKIAEGLTVGMRILLARHGEGWKSSLYWNQYRIGDGRQPYWANPDCTYAPPIFMVREALIKRRLIEHFDDAAGITPLGCRVLQAIRDSDGNPQGGDGTAPSRSDDSAGRNSGIAQSAYPKEPSA